MISVFTPSHDPKRIDDAYESLRRQECGDWEWIVLLNNGAAWEPYPKDPRVHVFRDDSGNKNVGYLKRLACGHAQGDIFVELDHDDLLTPDCLSSIQAVYDLDPEATFVYSNSVNVDIRNNKPVCWSPDYGWRNTPFKWNGLDLIESHSADPDPQSISRIWFAPNHVRSWRRDAYWRVGGHDPSMKISDDHDLMLRTWIDGKMVHLDHPLYIYRVHGDNTWLEHQKMIQTTMWQNHDKYIGPMAIEWSRRMKLRAIDICSGPTPEKGYEGVDIHHGPIKADLTRRWPFRDNSVGVIRAHDAIEHLHDPIHTMNEAWRVLAHGGFFLISVPSTKGEGAWCDPTHVSFWNARSFRYYTQPVMRAFIEPRCVCRFQALKVVDFNQWELPYVAAHLVALKGGKRYYGEMLWGTT